jgi:hypothetical protein
VPCPAHPLRRHYRGNPDENGTPGDFNEDGRINILDLIEVGNALGAKWKFFEARPSNWRPGQPD